MRCGCRVPRLDSSENRKSPPHNGATPVSFPMLTLILMAKLVCEVALLSLLGRGVLALLSGEGRDSNVFYALLRAVTQPWVKAVGWFTPSVVLERHHPWVAFWVLGVGWLGATWAKVTLCLEIGVVHCR